MAHAALGQGLGGKKLFAWGTYFQTPVGDTKLLISRTEKIVGAVRRAREEIVIRVNKK